MDIDFVRKAVRTIGRLAIKVPAAANACIKVLLELMESKISYVTQEVVVVIKDIFRRYPNEYESVIPTLCENIDDLTEPESKAAIVWIIGQYANRIDNSLELLEDLSYSFLEDPVEVRGRNSSPQVVLACSCRFCTRFNSLSSQPSLNCSSKNQTKAKNWYPRSSNRLLRKWTTRIFVTEGSCTGVFSPLMPVLPKI